VDLFDPELSAFAGLAAADEMPMQPAQDNSPDFVI
jgi:hypothetical protein